MLTVVHVWLASSFVFAAVLLFDQLRRPVSAWAAAGRQRRFWVTFTLLMGFHGLGPFAAAGYLTVVVPRFRAGGPVAQPRPAAQWMGRAAAVREGQRTATEALVLVAALLIFASSFIHAAVIADHFDYWVPFGLAFAIATGAQAAWVALVYRAPLNRRLLVAGALGNGALVAVWAISRTVGHASRPEAVDSRAGRGRGRVLDARRAHGRRPDRIRARRVSRWAHPRLATRCAACLVARRAAVHLEHPRGVRRGASPLR